jgi:hypothetical protein
MPGLLVGNPVDTTGGGVSVNGANLAALIEAMRLNRPSAGPTMWPRRLSRFLGLSLRSKCYDRPSEASRTGLELKPQAADADIFGIEIVLDTLAPAFLAKA